MWIFTPKGLLSIVQVKGDASRLLVRARQEGLLELVVPRPEDVFFDRGADYPFRIALTRDEVKALVSAQVDRIDYPNFKGSIRDEQYHDVCLRVWSTAKSLDSRK